MPPTPPSSDQPLQRNGLFSADGLLVIGSVVMVWLVVHLGNHWLLSLYAESPYIYWIYLPAAIRILAILLFDKIGFVGLFVGALLSNIVLHDRDWDEVLPLSLLSAMAPVLAVFVVRKMMRVPASLMGMRAVHLLAFALAGALCNSLLHSAYLTATDRLAAVSDGLLPMLIGDLLGTMLVLSLLAIGLRRWRLRARQRRS